MPTETAIFSSVPDRVLELLTGYLPSSLSILRRLQFARRDAGTNPHARTIFTSDHGRLERGSPDPKIFVVAHVDLFYNPNTQIFLYSSLESQNYETGYAQDQSEHEALLATTVESLVRLRREGGSGERYPRRLILGSLHSDVRAILERTGRIHLLPSRGSGIYDKWLFQAQTLPRVGSQLPEDMHWGFATLSDCQMVVSRTHILRSPDLLIKLHNLMVKLQDLTPIAWAFLGIDGSIISLHCEESHRRNGLAKALAAKLLRESTNSHSGDKCDGWASADVSTDNGAGQSVCKSLNGQRMWSVSW
ncbi:acetyltransferase [Hirsutella rhossiliensis]|uniref:Acetyltransferase n=1 Tax=Hirsutella rhossiliensis TaxID=111463 RepID=A0A9P8MM91_9HYPO|nr:acetyltransferase [Hirsutella rhossiliensis]KAH0957577.1 acetyltransferase [Hirsutella rhossiliensis]